MNPVAGRISAASAYIITGEMENYQRVFLIRNLKEPMIAL